MANQCVYTRSRTMCSVSPGHLCERWWYILCVICVLLFLPYISAKSSMPVASVSMYPEGDLYVRHGEDLEIFCTAGTEYTSKDLNFTLAGKVIPSEIVNSSTIRLYKAKPSKHLRQTIYCKNVKSGVNALKSVIVGSPPANVKDFMCISKNIDVLNCSWSTPDLIIFTNYSVVISYRSVVGKACIAMAVEGTLTRYCLWNATSTPQYRQQEEIFHFDLTSVNKFGMNKESFTIDHSAVVKPDPPINLMNVSATPHSVLLQWKVSNNIYYFLYGGVEHKIEYQIAKTEGFNLVNTSALPASNETYMFNLSALPYAHMQYGVRVYIKPVHAKSDRYWSDFSNIVVYTPSEKPNRPPDTAAGAFRQNKYVGYRVVYVYWKQLEECEEAGANFTYKIVVKDSKSPNPKTHFPDKNRSMGFLVLDNATLDAMEIEMWSFNEKGSSVNSSHLYIPPEIETHSLYVNSFSKLAYENGTYELSWVGIDNIDNYTLFWCQHNTTDICNGRINFTILNPKQDKHLISLPRIYRYQFAISANKGTKTSGMIWAKCDISKEEIAMYRFPLEFSDHDAPGKSFVRLKWSMDCILKEGIIIGYNISYCPVIQTSNLCDKTDKNLSQYINDPKQMSTTIENLERYKTYQFTMALNTIYGLKTIENATVHITTLEDTPTTPRNVTVSDVKYNSLVIAWDRPEHINGHISKIKYIIYNYNETIHEVKYDDKLSNVLRRNVILKNLIPFTNYSLSIQACNEGINSCSHTTNPITLRTCIGYPSKLNPPQFQYYPDVLIWKAPEIYGGTVDQYQIKIIKTSGNIEIVNTTDLSYPLPQCQGVPMFDKYQVRAVNFNVDIHSGAASDSDKVVLPTRDPEATEMLTYPGTWSDESLSRCQTASSLFLVYILMGLVSIIGAGFGILKVYRKIRRMKDIKPEFPKGLFIVPEKDLSKYPFNGLYPPEKNEKPTSDEMLLLPNSKTTSSLDIKQSTTKDADNCGSSDQTDSTGLSDASQAPIDRQNSTSDDDSHSSLRLEVEPMNPDSNNAIQGHSSNTDTESSRENSPYFSDNTFKKNKVNGYVQSAMSPVAAYVKSVPLPFKSLPQNAVSPPASSSYVMAGLPQSLFGKGVTPPASSQPPHPSGYVCPEDTIARSAMNFSRPPPTKLFGSESLPTMPTLPPSTKNVADNSYIQLQSLDALPSQKPTVRNTVPFKPPTSSGYVSPEDAVINKHLKNIMSGGQLVEESAILDPAMSPDAYCRFSWSTDPANDNLHSLLGNAPTH